MTQKIQQLMELLAQDKEAMNKQDELEAMEKEDAKAWLISWAAKKGIEVTGEELDKELMNEDDLEDVSGGHSVLPLWAWKCWF